MTNIEKALALINTFATGDTEKAASLLAEGYIQHNLAYGTGRDAFVGSVAWLASAPVKTTVQNIRAFEDGDKVFLQTVYNFAGAGEQVAFDIFRFDADGMIAEHWDNLAAKADPNPSGHTQIDGCKELKDLDSSKYEETGAKGDYYTNQFQNQIANYKITTDEGFTVLLWNSEMYDQYGYEARMWFYKDAQPDLFMYQVAGASFNYDRRNPECGPMGRFVASVRPKAALPEHQQHFAYSELDAIATQFCGYCDEQGVSCEFLTPETGVWYGYTKDADGTVHVYRLLDPAPN